MARLSPDFCRMFFPGASGGAGYTGHVQVFGGDCREAVVISLSAGEEQCHGTQLE
ncbi:hypothetical protein ACFWSJ_32810 [Streptomyces niveus]|uniref:hypothetical protein n=1 Tax=Streptomyces niveus TaxID=193462 RepID=UPI003669F045